MEFYKKRVFLNKLIKLIEHCNDIILNIYNNEFDIEYKNDKSPLTNADIECNNYICNNLRKLNDELKMDILIISEENKNLEYEKRKNYDWVWLVDPLDGTKEFMKKNGQFTVNIGLCYKQEVIFGIVGIPVKGDIYYGIKDIGSYKYSNNIINKIKINKNK